MTVATRAATAGARATTTPGRAAAGAADQPGRAAAVGRVDGEHHDVGADDRARGETR